MHGRDERNPCIVPARNKKERDSLGNVGIDYTTDKNGP
jgi:hypothetical protein